MLRPRVFRPVAVAAVLALAGTAAIAQTDTKPAAKEAAASQPADARPYQLMVGDKAPPLTVEKWVKGEPITGFEKGKVYVVEFWATWCGPCIAAMPHLTELQKQYKDDGVTIIGMTSPDRSNTLAKVEKMVAEKGDTMGYTVAWDTERKTNEAYMRAAGQNGIPCSFVVDREGRIAYIGHPLGLDEPLAKIVAGTYDIEKAAADYRKARELESKLEPLQQRLIRALQAQDWKAAKDAASEVADLEPLTGAQMLNYVAWTIVDPDGHVQDKDLDTALAAAERAADLTGHKDAAILDTLAMAHFLRGDAAKAIEIQTKAVELARDSDLKAELQGRLDEFKAKK